MKTGKQICREYLKNTGSVPRESEGGFLPSAPGLLAACGSEGFAEPLEVLLLHEDLPTGLRAKHILDNLEAKLETRPRFLIDLWRFDMLQEPELQERAVEDAKQANIVIISLHGHQELPAMVCHWLQRWIEARNDGSCALVVSLDASAKGSAAAEWTTGYLRRAAEQAGLDIFPHFGDTTASPRNWNLQQPQPHLTTPALDGAAGQISRSRFASGINE